MFKSISTANEFIAISVFALLSQSHSPGRSSKFCNSKKDEWLNSCHIYSQLMVGDLYMLHKNGSVKMKTSEIHLRTFSLFPDLHHLSFAWI